MRSPSPWLGNPFMERSRVLGQPSPTPRVTVQRRGCVLVRGQRRKGRFRSGQCLYHVSSVIPVNNAPVALAQSIATVENMSVTITLAATGVDGDALAFAVVGQPAHGTLAAGTGAI